jgi:quinoprotein glucose dehydrogenase
MVQLFPADSFDPELARQSERLGEGYEYTRMNGTPYVMRRRILLGPSQLPCSPPPFGSLVAVSLRTGEKLWDVPLGTVSDPQGNLAPAEFGSPNLGGPIATAGGLVFIGAALDRRIHAFDIENGRMLWQAELPVSGKATAMTYEADGRQFVVIAAGGGDVFGTSDTIIAFALPR